MEKTALNNIVEFVGKGGLVAFEHGFKHPTFRNEGYKYSVYMISDKIVYCRKYYVDGTSRPCNLLLSNLPERTLNKLYNSLNNYLEYCKTEA